MKQFTFIKKNITVLMCCGILVLVFLTSSCDKALETKVFGAIAPENFFKSEPDFNTAIAALYSRFGTNWGASEINNNNSWHHNMYGTDGNAYVMGSCITTDELRNTWVPDYYNFSWTPSNSTANGTYFALVPWVSRATAVIDNMQASKAVNESIKAKYIAEAKVIRAWMMWILYDFFGPVNVKLDPKTVSDIAQTPRPSVEEYVKAIEKDIQEAMPYLQANTNGSSANWGRVNQGSASMILLRLHLRRKNWPAATATAKSIVAMNKWSINPSYIDVFTKSKNSEIIYAVPCNLQNPNWYPNVVFRQDIKSFTVAGKSYNAVPGWSAEGIGWYMPRSFYATFNPADLRRQVILTSYINTSDKLVDNINPMPLKYTDVTQSSSNQYTMDWVVFRYPEVLLSLAESLNEENGPTSEALGYIKQVRDRAGLSTNSWNLLSKSQLRDSLLAERGREFFCEGLRRGDLIRHGKLIEYAKQRGINATDKDTLFPIPQKIILQGNGVIAQNQGYSQ